MFLQKPRLVYAKRNQLYTAASREVQVHWNEYSRVTDDGTNRLIHV